MKFRSLVVVFLIVSLVAMAENGSQLWLRFDKAAPLTAGFNSISGDPALKAFDEFQRACRLMTSAPLPVVNQAGANGLLIATASHPAIRALKWSKELRSLGPEGYLIRTVRLKGKPITVVTANQPQGVLYGVYHLLRIMQTGQSLSDLTIREVPTYQLRILNHWDNLNGTVERGYAGHSIWKWNELPAVLSPRYEDYARANASIGINATVLNNVNATPDILTAEYIRKIKAIAAVVRPFHIKVFISINFASPRVLGNLPDADPLRPEVRRWWKQKVAEIYREIPDFGGFLVKANSEGLPGPMDYGRTHADGANMIAEALEPYKGIVMWRAFVYEPGDDRAKLAYREFIGFDGGFHDNVIIQVKNGPIDFQPREPFSPLFGAMKKTPLMPELQITQEYLGHSNHLAFLAPMWEEVLDADTYAFGEGSTVSKVTDGSFVPAPVSAIAGVANIGEDVNWTGHHFGQANWYAFGRLAWNAQLSSETIAREWLAMTFGSDKKKLTVETVPEDILSMMLGSHQTVVDYMMPLGLHHIFAWDHHYGPEPWCDIPGARPDWLPRYYHNASKEGLGFNRTASGSNAVAQYSSPLKEWFDDPATCPEKYLLWFHHLPWNYRMKSGRTLWDELCFSYDRGVQTVRDYQKIWDRNESWIDAQRFREVQSRLKIQSKDAVWWKDAILLYFQTYSQQPIPYSIERPVHELDDLKKVKLDMKHHN